MHVFLGIHLPHKVMHERIMILMNWI